MKWSNKNLLEVWIVQLDELGLFNQMILVVQLDEFDDCPTRCTQNKNPNFLASRMAVFG